MSDISHTSSSDILSDIPLLNSTNRYKCSDKFTENHSETIYESEIESISDDAMIYVSSDDSSNEESDYFDINNGDYDDNSNIPISIESEHSDIISNM